MSIADLRQKILSSTSRALLSVYSAVVLFLIVLVMIWHRAWKIQPRQR